MKQVLETKITWHVFIILHNKWYSIKPEKPLKTIKLYTGILETCQFLLIPEKELVLDSISETANMRLVFNLVLQYG